MAGAKPHFAPHEAFASASAPAPAPASADPNPAADEDGDAEVVVFRLLLPRAFSDQDALLLYAAIAPLRLRNPALQVCVDALGSHSDASRVAVVLGPTSPTRRVEASSSSGEPLELSPAQEALVSVLNTGVVLHRAVGRGPESVTCLVLVEVARLDAAVGMGVLQAIAMEAGAEVRVPHWVEDPLLGEQPPEEVVEITGDRTTVRKAIVALSSCLQGDLLAGSSTTSANIASAMLLWTSSEVPEPNLGTLHSEVSTECASSNIPQIDCPQGVTGDVQTKDLQQISFRLLCHVNLAGGLIGSKGMVIKKFEDETGTSIDVGSPLSGCKERVITISALESPGPQYSKVQNALLRIFDRMEEIESNARTMFNKTYQCSARVLVLKSQYDWLVGLDGAMIKELVKSTSTRIQILDESDAPACASYYERVLQITGEQVNVRDTLLLVSEKLRNHAFSSKRTKYNDGYATSSDVAESTTSSQVNISSIGHCSTVKFLVDHGSSLNEMDPVENSFSTFHLRSPGSSALAKAADGNDAGINSSENEMQKSANGSGSGSNNPNNVVQKPANGNGDRINKSDHGITSLEENKLARGIKTTTITRITYEIAVCGSILHLVYGDNGNNLAQIREISGADITVYHPPPLDTSDSTIVISGTPDKAQLGLAMFIGMSQKQQ